MGTTTDKLVRLNETKALLKTRLTEKGLDVASENNFYNLADKVGEIQSGAENFSITYNPVPVESTPHLFFFDSELQSVRDLKFFDTGVVQKDSLIVAGAEYSGYLITIDQYSGLEKILQTYNYAIFKVISNASITVSGLGSLG